MNIYFHSSLLGKKQFSQEYNSIVGFLKDLKHTVTSEHLLKLDYQDVATTNQKEVAQDIKEKKNLIKASDTVIVESTYPSIGVGYIIAYALGQHKNVLVLYTTSAHAILLAENNRLLTLKKYSIQNKDKLFKDLKSFLSKTEEKILKYRFNMMIDKNLNDLLAQESTKQGISKADYVRKMIFEKISLSK